ncbi:MAG: TolC family protein [Proteobacteria bacterium]|nr:TolC family protein [Pseudomonadota bacterium]
MTGTYSSYLHPLLLVIFCLVPLEARAGYGDFQREIEEYDPPALYHSSIEKSAQTPEATQPDTAFNDAVQQLQKIQSQWQEAVNSFDGDNLFYRPDRADLLRLAKARTDPAFTERIIASPFSLQEMELLVLLRNPAIKASFNQLLAAIEKYSQVTAVDEILKQYASYAINSGIGPMKNNQSVKMSFPFPGVVALKGEIVNQDILVESLNLEITRRSMITRMRKAFWNLVFNHQAGELLKEKAEITVRLEKITVSSYETGKAEFTELIDARIKKEIIDQELLTILEVQKNIETEIRELLDLRAGSAIAAPLATQEIRETVALEPLVQTALAQRQEIVKLKAMIAKMEKMLEMGETMTLAPFTLNLSLYENNPVMKTGSQASQDAFPVKTMAAQGAGLPVNPWFGSNDSYLRQLRLDLAANRHTLTDIQGKTRTLVRNKWSVFDQNLREYKLYAESLTALSRAALDVAQSSYQSGKIPFGKMAASYFNWISTRLASENKRKDASIAFAELEEAAGKSIPLKENPSDITTGKQSETPGE